MFYLRTSVLRPTVVGNFGIESLCLRLRRPTAAGLGVFPGPFRLTADVRRLPDGLAILHFSRLRQGTRGCIDCRSFGRRFYRGSNVGAGSRREQVSEKAQGTSKLRQNISLAWKQLFRASKTLVLHYLPAPPRVLLMMGLTWWIVVGTTTTVSVLLLLANTLKFQEYLASIVSHFLTRKTGISISFEEAIVPRWMDARVRLSNVSLKRSAEDARRINSAALDLRIAAVDVRLSIVWWLLGNGLLKELVIDGVEGFVDRRNMDYSNWDPLAVRSKPDRGNMSFSLLKIENAHFFLYNNQPERPLPVSIYTLESGLLLRLQWLLHDLARCKHIHGAFDNCLFSLVPLPGNHTSMQTTEPLSAHVLKESASPWRQSPIERLLSSDVAQVGSLKHLRGGRVAEPFFHEETKEFTISGVPFEHIYENTTGPLHWINRGLMDVRLVMSLPREILAATEETSAQLTGNVELTLHNIAASMPIKPVELSYARAALVRPMLIYLNTNYSKIDLSFGVKFKQHELYGGWYPDDIQLWQILSRGAYQDLARIVQIKRAHPTRTLYELAGTGLDGIYRGIKYVFKYYFWVYIYPAV